MSDEIRITYETLFDFLMNEKKKSNLQPLPKTFFDDVLNYIKKKYDNLTNTKTEDLIFSLEKEKGLRELNNIKAIVREIIERRIKKIMDLALVSMKTNTISEEEKNLLEEERRLFDLLKDPLIKYNQSVVNNLMNLTRIYFNLDLKDNETEKDNVQNKIIEDDRNKLKEEINQKTEQKDNEKNKKDNSNIKDKFETTDLNLEEFTVIRVLTPLPKFIGADLKIYGPYLEDDIVKLPKNIADLLIKKKRAEKIEIS